MSGPSLACGKIETLKRSHRSPILLAGLAGACLIAFGLYVGQSGPDANRTAGIHPTDEPSDLFDLTPKGGSPVGPKGPARPGAQGSIEPKAERIGAFAEPVTVTVLLTYRNGGMPVANAQVSLWREQTGEGAAFRPARRHAQTRSDVEGSAQLTAPPNEALEVYAMAPGNGPLARLRLGSLTPGQTRSVRLQLERPPEPLNLTVLDQKTGEPVSGAALRVTMTSQQNLGVEEFPGTAKLVQRTDGDGRAVLPGPTRKGLWILVDAAGYSPTAIDLRQLEGIRASEVQLKRAAKVTALVVNGAGQALADIQIQCIGQLGRFRTTFTAVTNSRGEATLARVPAGIPLVPHVGPVDDVPALFDALTLEPGEARKLKWSL